jgi:hypothetical protein
MNTWSKIDQKRYLLQLQLKFNTFKVKAHKIIFRNSVCTTQKIPHFIIIMIMWLVLSKEIIPAYSENHMKP